MLYRNAMAAAALLVCASTSGAFAANWPTTLAGSSWSGDANGTQLQLNVTTEGGGGQCQTVAGTMVAGGGTTSVNGYYCPATGSVELLRTNGAVTFQVFSGTISQSPDPSLLGYIMSGNFGQYVGAGLTGQYPFSLGSFLNSASVRR